MNNFYPEKLDNKANKSIIFHINFINWAIFISFWKTTCADMPSYSFTVKKNYGFDNFFGPRTPHLTILFDHQDPFLASKVKTVQLLDVCIDFRVFSQFVLFWDKIVLPLHLSDFSSHIRSFDWLVFQRPYFYDILTFSPTKFHNEAPVWNAKFAQCIVFIFKFNHHIHIKIWF